MYRRFRLLQFSCATLGLLGYAELGLDFMAAVFTIRSFRRGIRLRHGRVLCKFALRLKLFLDFRDHLLILLRGEPFLSQQVLLKTVNAVALAPELMHLFGDIRRGV